MSLCELYTKDTRVWVACKEIVWKSGKLNSAFAIDHKSIKIVCDADDQIAEVAVDPDNPLSFPPLCNPDVLIGENDLTSLSHLHEPAVLFNLSVRFSERQQIYTYCGIVLVAINPYQTLEIYNEDVIQAYSGQEMLSMDPHIFAVAEDAFKNMSRFNINQSLIVSGESGSGKTVSAKYAMRYFATVCGAAVVETRVEDKVLASNPIMEAIGNAKTTRNDNSSRFGKYIEINFDSANSIVGANMKTYLLEKSRVVFQASSERNYHIFYQLCDSRDLPELEFLSLEKADSFHYLNQGLDINVDNINDAEEFVDTRKAFSLLGINSQLQMEIFRVLAAILHLGNVNIKYVDEDTSTIDLDDPALTAMVRLLGIDAGQMAKWLCNRKIVAVGEVLQTPLSRDQASDGRDALAKYIYAGVFKWVVYELNKELYGGATKQPKFIGVLDIYGFETFEINSFEQFCINYANEKLQQQFCMHVFKLEQAEYVKEEISWSFIDFYDNQPCIELIEGKLGILGLLDEECRLAKGSDENWCQKLYSGHSSHVHFDKPRLSRDSFIIVHFADSVCYSIAGFVEKNRDRVLLEHINILKASQYSLVAELFVDNSSSEKDSTPKSKVHVRAAAPAAKPSKKSNTASTVGMQFRDSLKQLMVTLTSTTPHYIRCIKPNDSKQAFQFDPHRAVQQLRACGVLETVRISAAGYPSRWLYHDFLRRYRALGHSSLILDVDHKTACERIICKVIEQADKYQFGKSKVFFRAGQVAYLESLRNRRLCHLVTTVQTGVRGWLHRLRYARTKRAVLVLQTATRALLARRLAQRLREQHCSVVIQSCWRSYRQRKRFNCIRNAALVLQTHTRGLLARRALLCLRKRKAATILQTATRGYFAKKRYERLLRGIVALQSHVRRKAARRVFKTLKVEARSVDHIKKVAKGLENKIIELQQKLDVKANECTSLRDSAKRTNAKQAEDKLAYTHNLDLKTQTIETLNKSVNDMKLDAAEHAAKIEQMTNDKKAIIKERDQLSKTIEIERDLGEQKIAKFQKLIEDQKKEIEDAAITELALQESQNIEDEIENERRNHQKLIKDHERLQQRYDNLHNDLNTPTTPSAPSRTFSEASIDSDVSSNLTIMTDDLGYGSTHKKSTSKQHSGQSSAQDIEWQKSEEKLTAGDVSLISRLQRKISTLERYVADFLNNQPENNLDEDNVSHDIYESIEKHSINVENHRLQEQIELLRRGIAHDLDKTSENAGFASKELMTQFGSIVDELSMKKQECIQLRTLIAVLQKKTAEEDIKNASNIVSHCYGDAELVNEDGELDMAYATQCELNKLMEKEMLKQREQADAKEAKLTQRIDQLNAENKRQNEIILKNFNLNPDLRLNEFLQSEITRVIKENLDLNDKHISSITMIKKLKKAYKNKINLGHEDALLPSTPGPDMPSDSVQRNEPDREYLGMLEYKDADEHLLIKCLITDLSPRQALQNPGLSADLIFMCIRHIDFENKDNKVKTLLSDVIMSIKSSVKKYLGDIEYVAMFLNITCRLLTNIKQYSDDKAYTCQNTSKQAKQCLRSFDLKCYRDHLSNLAIWIFQGIIKLLYTMIRPLIVAGILETISIVTFSSKPTGIRGQPDKQKETNLNILLHKVKSILLILRKHQIEKKLIDLIMKQLFYFICSTALNNLLLRNELCNWSRGIQIKYNMSQVDQWIRDNDLKDSGALETVLPCVQVSKLLQSTSTMKMEELPAMCCNMTTLQIIRVLQLYTPVETFESRVPQDIIKKIKQYLLDQRSEDDKGNTPFLMDTKYQFNVNLPFVRSNVCLEDVCPPNDWGLNFVKRI